MRLSTCSPRTLFAPWMSHLAMMRGQTEARATMGAPMRPDPRRLAPSFRMGGMVSRIAGVLILLVDLAGCGPTVGTGVKDICLEQHPGDDGCCAPDGHVDHGICCPNGSHAVSD